MVALGLVFGWLVGTVLAATLDRLYTGAAWRGPMLPCQSCERPLPRVTWLGVPGFLALWGRCPACAAPLPWRVLYLPVLSAAVYGVAVARTDGLHLLLALLFTPALLALTAADIEERLLPNRIMYPTLLLALALCWAWPGRTPLNVLAGGLIAAAVMLALYLLLPGFGFGDVKLAGLLGLVAGASNVLTALMLAVLASGVVAVLLLVTRRATLRTSIAYGPYLALGAFAAMLAG